MRTWTRVAASLLALGVFVLTPASAWAFALQPHQVKKAYERANRQALQEMGVNGRPAQPAGAGRAGGATPGGATAAPVVDPQAAEEAAEAAAIAKLRQRRELEAAQRARKTQQRMVLGGIGGLVVVGIGAILLLRRTGQGGAKPGKKATSARSAARRT